MIDAVAVMEALHLFARGRVYFIYHSKLVGSDVEPSAVSGEDSAIGCERRIELHMCLNPSSREHLIFMVK